MHTGGGGRRGGISCAPSKDFEKFYHKNAIKRENRGTPPRFSQKNLKMTVHLFLTQVT
jgi:hypothetical protein